MPSRQTKTVINVAFSSENPGKYQGYVHVKTNYDTMIIPLEVAGLAPIHAHASFASSGPTRDPDLNAVLAAVARQIIVIKLLLPIAVMFLVFLHCLVVRVEPCHWPHLVR